MGLLDTYKTKKAIATIQSAETPTAPEVTHAVLKIKTIGALAIPRLIEALSEHKNIHVFENLLSGFLNNSSMFNYIEYIGQINQDVDQVLTKILSESNHYDPNNLLEYFNDPDAPINILFDILKARKDRINHKILLNELDHVPRSTRAVIYQLLDLIADEQKLPDYIRKTQHDDPEIRIRMIRTLSNFSTEEVKSTLISFLGDSNKNVRLAVLEGISRLDMPVSAGLICPLLGDPNITVQSRAIETLTKIKDKETIRYLIAIMQDDSEYVRRAAVEVLNEVGDSRAVKDLLNALRDKDWWVRVRAADALGTIGGPKVVDAVLELVKDKDDFMRRTAIEILNTSKDERALDHLIAALNDDDWWVKERAADALASLGDKRAIEPLKEFLKQGPQASQVAMRALAALGDSSAIEPIITQLESNNESVCKEALHALNKLTDKNNTQRVKNAVTQMIQQSDYKLSELANETIDSIVSRNCEETVLIETPEPIEKRSGISNKHNQDSRLDSSTGNELSLEYIDPAKLAPGTTLSERYRVIKKIGRGAFGVIILAKDLMINEEFILKFLKPQDTSDNNALERFKYELRYARKVTHKNVIRIYDLLTFGNNYAISMEYFPSHSLADELVKKQPLELARGLNILIDICHGMSAAQAEHVVHRDLKPANILINDNNLTKIVDFGIAAAASQSDSRLTKSGMLIGTPTYMAPEQAHGRTLDSRTDIYSLGIIMYEMFTGRAPYEGEYPMATLFKHVEGKATPPRKQNAKIPHKLEKIILKAMSVEPDNRFKHFDEMRSRLNAVLKDATSAQSM